MSLVSYSWRNNSFQARIQQIENPINKIMIKKIQTSVATTVITTGVASAAVTYVDADPTGNTTLADGTAMVLDSVGYSSSQAADGLWDERAFGNSGSIYQGGIGEDAARLRTQMSGLTVGETYEVYAYFWGAGIVQTWRGRASLTDDAGDLPGYNTVHFGASSFSPMTYLTSPSAGTENPGPLSTQTGGLEDGGYFTSSSIIVEESDRRLYQISLGTAVADGSGNINVYIDDLADTSQVNRAWYDGVGHELVAVPEPSTGLLGAFGLLSLLRRRR